MAYVSKEDKAIFATEIKKVMPKGWKFSIARVDCCAIRLTIISAPIDLMASLKNLSEYNKENGYADLNCCYLESSFDGELLEIFKTFNDVLNEGNHNNSDCYTDYHDVGWYVLIRIGKWDKPFVVK